VRIRLRDSLSPCNAAELVAGFIGAVATVPDPLFSALVTKGAPEAEIGSSAATELG
jgi:hypothetical protein